LVDANVETVMCAYNRTNDQPCCANNFLLTETLRKAWGFKGHVVSDCWAIVDFYQKDGHKTVPTQAEAVALSVKSGVSLNCGDEYPALVEAVQKGLITEKEIDAALEVLLKTRFKLGLFDSPEKNPYNKISADVINSEKHRALAKEAATKSIVLLKNNGVLPLKNDLSKYFVTGPNAESVYALMGNYYGVNPHMVTYLEGLAAGVQAGSQLQYKPGVMIDRANVNPIDWTTGDAKGCDVTFLIMGITGVLEGEEGESIASPHYGDRLDYNLPKNQIDFLKKIRGGNSKPIIAVVTGGSPMNLSEVHELADAVLLVWYGGEEAGSALADIVFGKVSPSGRLPITFPKSLEQLPPYEDYSMKGRTYRYMNSEPMYPFGYGLTYGKFSYSELKLSSVSVKKNQPVDVEVTVTNNGSMSADEVVQLYITDLDTKFENPLHSLKGFQRITLATNSSQIVKFRLLPEMFETVNDKGMKIIDPGKFKVTVGGASPGTRAVALGQAESVSSVFTVK
jgi:beta-glucosidase